VTTCRARDLTAGMIADIPPGIADGTINQQAAALEYADVQSVGGGWADRHARHGQVVLYIANFPAPVIIDGDTPLEVQED
jgi:hypothetical protein